MARGTPGTTLSFDSPDPDKVTRVAGAFERGDCDACAITGGESTENEMLVLIGRVQAGEIIEVTRRRKAVARITPTSGADEPEDWPDLAARTRSVFGSRKIDPAPSAQVAADRGRW